MTRSALEIKGLVRTHFTFLADFYDHKCLDRQVYLDAIDKLVFAHLSRHKNQRFRVLDAGCGTAQRTKKYRAQFANGSVYGCDFCPKVLEIAKSKQIHGLVSAEMAALPFMSQSVDVVLCLFNAFGYLPNRDERQRTLLEFYRILRDDGVLFIDVLNRWHLGEGATFKRRLATAVWQWLCGALHPGSCRGDLIFVLQANSQRVSGWVHGFARTEMVRLLRKAGFIISRSLVVGYDTGHVKKKCWQGQLFFVARKQSHRTIP